MLIEAAAQVPGMGGDVVGNMVKGICGFIDPFVGQQSQVLSLILLIGLGVILIMWFLNENKEGLIVWGLRAGLIIGLLINLYRLPILFGLPSVCA